MGVVGNVRGAGPAEDEATEVYFPYQQQPWRVMTIVVRTFGNPDRVLHPVRGAIRALDPDLPLYNVSTMTTAYESWFADRRTLMMAGSFFAASALDLAALGVYSLFSYLVSLRTPEFGIRMAVGARRADLLRLVTGDASRWVLLGVALGVPVAAVVAQFLKRFLFEVSPRDLTTLLSASAVVFFAGLGASYIPARRAAGVDPRVALRHE